MIIRFRGEELHLDSDELAAIIGLEMVDDYNRKLAPMEQLGLKAAVRPFQDKIVRRCARYQGREADWKQLRPQPGADMIEELIRLIQQTVAGLARYLEVEIGETHAIEAIPAATANGHLPAHGARPELRIARAAFAGIVFYPEAERADSADKRAPADADSADSR